mgnify:CR=1 FL=1
MTIKHQIFLEHLNFSKKTLNDQKSKFTTSDFQKSERDFAFVLDKNFKVQELIDIISNVDKPKDQLIISLISIVRIAIKAPINKKAKNIATIYMYDF